MPSSKDEYNKLIDYALYLLNVPIQFVILMGIYNNMGLLFVFQLHQSDDCLACNLPFNPGDGCL